MSILDIAREVFSYYTAGAAVLGAGAVGYWALFKYRPGKNKEIADLTEKHKQEIQGLSDLVEQKQETLDKYQEKEKEQTFIGILREVITTEEEIEEFARQIRDKEIPSNSFFEIKLKMIERYARRDLEHDTNVLARKIAVYKVEDLTQLADIYAQFKEGEDTCRIDITGTHGAHGILEANDFQIYEDFRLKEAIQNNLPAIWKTVKLKFKVLDELIESGIFEDKSKKLTLEDLNRKQNGALKDGYFSELNKDQIGGIRSVVYDPYKDSIEARRELKIPEEGKPGLESFWELMGPKSEIKPEEPKKEVKKPPMVHLSAPEKPTAPKKKPRKGKRK